MNIIDDNDAAVIVRHEVVVVVGWLGLLRAGKACQLSCAAERGHIGGRQGRSHLYPVERSL